MTRLGLKPRLPNSARQRRSLRLCRLEPPSPSRALETCDYVEVMAVSRSELPWVRPSRFLDRLWVISNTHWGHRRLREVLAPGVRPAQVDSLMAQRRWRQSGSTTLCFTCAEVAPSQRPPDLAGGDYRHMLGGEHQMRAETARKLRRRRTTKRLTSRWLPMRSRREAEVVVSPPRRRDTHGSVMRPAACAHDPLPG